MDFASVLEQRCAQSLFIFTGQDSTPAVVGSLLMLRCDAWLLFEQPELEIDEVEVHSRLPAIKGNLNVKPTEEAVLLSKKKGDPSAIKSHLNGPIRLQLGSRRQAGQSAEWAPVQLQCIVFMFPTRSTIRLVQPEQLSAASIPKTLQHRTTERTAATGQNGRSGGDYSSQTTSPLTQLQVFRTAD
ncbi:hypothetical protein EYF80_027424 [Liparis tanakae]|uniref:Uncharacterized protein n=1 Tax=Liparis tanakae TaxID=230148 RepID=A0A4Z2HBT5_9TELE|nr:hypothetical protein EYF80_027424 [Liparis tanakae]